MMNRFWQALNVLAAVVLAGAFAVGGRIASADTPTPSADPLVAQASAAISKAADAFAEAASVRGGYVYQVTLDGQHRFGEGRATATEVWVQPPGTPTVGLAMLRGYQATGDKRLLEHATAAANALLHGQLQSGAWTDRVDFDPKGKSVGPYRNGKGNKKGRNYSTLDDDKSQAAIRFLIEMDSAYDQKHHAIHDAVTYALDSLLKAQFANGGFPQGWQKPVESYPVTRASYPTYDWRTEGRIKEYWDYETLNDGLAGTVTATLWLAHQTYRDERYKNAMLKFGDFLIASQMPEPQPAWAQQYNHSLVPIWARKFEPPAIAGVESEDVLRTLMFIAEKTGERRFLQPIPAAIEWVKRSRLPNGQLARFYELKTNRPLYFVKDTYELTYDDSNLPTHYGFKTDTKIDKIEQQYQKLMKGDPPPAKTASLKSLRRDAEAVLANLDAHSRWVTTKDRRPAAEVRQGKDITLFLDSAVFSANLTRLADYLTAATKP
ncbi:MAG: pectate lyase [Planctomycetaceae bacterium]